MRNDPAVPGGARRGAMGSRGSCVAQPEPEVEEAECQMCVHQYLFPMYVVKVSDFLQMGGAPEPHHVLREKGLLQEWQPGMFVIFVSHQWLGAQQPDPNGSQLSVLRAALRGLIDRSLRVEADITSMDMSKALKPAILQKVGEGYLFLDWFAIPQITARKHGVNEVDILSSTRSDAALAVQSIPAYVEASDLFLALVPDLVHSDTGKQCNYLSWLSRGWCRAELWCRLLSNREDTTVVVIFSAQEAEFIFPMDWQQNRISDGLFTVESDREEVAKLGEMALRSKLGHLRVHGPLSHYRFYLARRPQLLNQGKEEWDLPGFLKFFDFPSVEAAVKEDRGMTGMLCAVLAGDAGILRQLVEHRAEANGRVLGMGDLGYYDSQTLLMVAAKSHQEPLVLSTLINLRADPNLVSRADIGPIWLARLPGHVRVLLAARADMHTSFPLNGVAGRGSAATVRVLLESRCDPSQGSSDGFCPLHSVTIFGRSNPDAYATTRLLVEYRADVNFRSSFSSHMSSVMLLAKAHVAIWGLEGVGTFWRKLATLPGATALAAAAMTGDKGLVELLLELHAEVDIPNYRGDTPEALARAGGHRDLLPLLDTFGV